MSSNMNHSEITTFLYNLAENALITYSGSWAFIADDDGHLLSMTVSFYINGHLYHTGLEVAYQHHDMLKRVIENKMNETFGPGNWYLVTPGFLPRELLDSWVKISDINPNDTKEPRYLAIHAQTGDCKVTVTSTVPVHPEGYQQMAICLVEQFHPVINAFYPDGWYFQGH